MKENFLLRLRTYFIAGLIVALPVFVSINIVIWLFGLALSLTSWMLPLFPEAWRPEALFGISKEESEFYLNIFVLLLTLIFIVIVGAAMTNVLGKWLLRGGESFLLRVPLFNKIYSTVKQLTGTLTKNQRAMFSKVVIFEYPYPGLFSMGFITSEKRGEIQQRAGEDLVHVFVPTAPNPTSGLLVIVPRAKLTILDMSVSDGFKFVLSGGSVFPPKDDPTLSQASPSTRDSAVPAPRP